MPLVANPSTVTNAPRRQARPPSDLISVKDSTTLPPMESWFLKPSALWKNQLVNTVPVTHRSFNMLQYVMFYSIYIIQSSTRQTCNISWSRSICRRVILCLCWLLHLRTIFDSSNLQCRWRLGLWGWREMEAEDCFAISRKVIATGPCEWGRAEIQRTPGVAGMEFQPHIWKDNRLRALQKSHGNCFLRVYKK